MDDSGIRYGSGVGCSSNSHAEKTNQNRNNSNSCRGNNAEGNSRTPTTNRSTIGNTSSGNRQSDESTILEMLIGWVKRLPDGINCFYKYVKGYDPDEKLEKMTEKLKQMTEKLKQMTEKLENINNLVKEAQNCEEISGIIDIMEKIEELSDTNKE